MGHYIRNENGLWLNTSVFREEGQNFSKTGMYCPDPVNSPAWIEYWEEQRKRIMYGYEVNGCKITGEHYFYLNFCPMSRAEDVNSMKTRKVVDFPDFWDWDYNYFWVREIARKGVLEAVLWKDDEREFLNRLQGLEGEHRLSRTKDVLDSLKLEVEINPKDYEGGKNLIVGKSRRRGYSYKTSRCAARNYIINPNSLWIFGAYDSKFLYPRGLMTMALDSINFLNTYTAFVMPSDEINRPNHIKSSYIEYQGGVKKVGGFKSEIMAITFKDNPDAARGKDAYEIDFEESGAFGTPGLLKKSLKASEDCVKAGVIKTGMIQVFGTSGDLGGGTEDYADMFNNPGKYDMISFRNQWDDEKNYVGFFHAANANLEGFYDKQGNSDLEGAKNAILSERKIAIENGASSSDLEQMMQEKPLSPMEAFTAAGTNLFPSLDLAKQKNYVTTNGLDKAKGQVIQLYRGAEGLVKASPVLDGSVEPIDSLNGAVKDKRGAIIIYEQPIPNAPYGSYCIGYDPVAQDEGTSYASVVVFKKFVRGSHTKNCVVAIWLGRNEDSDDNHLVAEMLAEYYGCKIMHENMVKDVKTYFRRRKKLHLLAAQPDSVISKSIKNSKVNRVYGCHLNRELKDSGEKYVKSWLIDTCDYDENGTKVLNLHRIYSVRLLEELIDYKSKSNKFDVVSALIMCMFQVEEDILIDEKYHEREDLKLKKLKTLFRN